LYIEVDIWVPLIQALSLEDLASWLYIEDDMRAPCVSSLLNVSKAAVDQKKKGNSQNQRVKNKSNKGEVYCPWRLTSGTHEPAASSTFRRRLGIERKKANSQKLGVQNNSKKGNVYCS
jgi:hypothetical protein